MIRGLFLKRTLVVMGLAMGLGACGGIPDGDPNAVEPSQEELATSQQGLQRNMDFRGCWIENGSTCSRDPMYYGKFKDTYAPANSDPTICKSRAAAWAEYCQNMPGTRHYATFWSNTGSPIGSESAYAPGCEVRVPTGCTNYPGLASSINDTYDNAKNNKDRCLQRAPEYTSWCGNKATQYIEANFYTTAGAVDTKFSYGAGCAIEGWCQSLNRQLNDVDTYADSATNSDRCLQRAAEYYNWCGNSPRMMNTYGYMHDINSVTARFSTIQDFTERTYSPIAPYWQY